MDKYLKNFGHNIFSYIRHPFGVTCLDCGFLVLGQDELNTTDRIRLHCKGTVSGCPPLECIQCFRSLWVDLDLTYSGSPPADVIFDKVGKQQRKCRGYFKYKPGCSPTGHQDLLLKSQDRKEKVFIALFSGLLGLILGLFGKWLARIFGLSSP